MYTSKKVDMFTISLINLGASQLRIAMNEPRPQSRRHCAGPTHTATSCGLAWSGIVLPQRQVLTIYWKWPDISPAGHAASSPQARARDLTSEDVLEFYKSLMQEGGRIELHRACTRLSAYKAGSTPNGLRLPYQFGVSGGIRTHDRGLTALRFRRLSYRYHQGLGEEIASTTLLLTRPTRMVSESLAPSQL